MLQILKYSSPSAEADGLIRYSGKQPCRPRNRSSFIKKIVKYVEENNLDGVDVDIEGNLFPYIGFTYGPFVVELKEALHAKGKGMSCALGAVDLR